MAPRLIADDIRELVPMFRAPGSHVSSIIRKICVSLGKFDDDRRAPRQIQLEAGNAFEDAIASALAQRHAKTHPDRYIHGCELELDGITGNLDLLDTVDFVPEEVKLTKTSIRHAADIEGSKFWHYWVQLKSYCWMIGAVTGRLHVCFVNGNYKYDDTDPESGWQYRVWEDTWTKRELADNWRMISGHR